MIKNERQYRITRAQAARFQRALQSVASARTPGIPALLKKAQLAAMRSQLQDLRQELREYQALRSGRRTISAPVALHDLPRVLIRARIAAGLTQLGLARRLGLKAQQVQRYEATEYCSASLERLQQVAHALGLAEAASKRPPARISRTARMRRKDVGD
jgi:ribosome-binding protein aMBF1 (putative translation factor)